MIDPNSENSENHLSFNQCNISLDIFAANEFEGWKAAVAAATATVDPLQPRSFINSTPGGDITRDITYAWTGLQTILHTDNRDNRT